MDIIGLQLCRKTNIVRLECESDASNIGIRPLGVDDSGQGKKAVRLTSVCGFLLISRFSCAQIK